MSGSSVAFLVLYVDDILLIGDSVELLKSVKEYLNSKFSMKDLGEAAYVLGIKIYRDRSRRLLALSQSTYLGKDLVPAVKEKTLSTAQCPQTAFEKPRWMALDMLRL